MDELGKTGGSEQSLERKQYSNDAQLNIEQAENLKI